MRRLAILLVVCFLFFPLNVSAQAVTIENIQISLWPEYDRPEVLVIYYFTLADSVTLPAALTIRIPASSGGPFTLAYAGLDENGQTQLYNLQYETRRQDDWLEVTFSAPAASIQLEYYDPGMLLDGDDRDFTYTWPADYAVRSMSMRVLRPDNATSMSLDPDLGAAGLYQDGRTYYQSLIGSVDAGEQFNLRMRYSRPDDAISAGYDAIFAAEEDASLRRFSLENAVPWVIGALGLLLITVAVLWYLVPNHLGPFRQKARSAGSRDITQRMRIYCHNCGSSAQPEDVFCRSCGTKLRK